MYNLFIFNQKMKNNLSTIASNDLTLKPVLIGMTRMTFRLVLFGLIAILAFSNFGCINTPVGNKFGVPVTRDKIISRYERPLDQILNSAREVLSRIGTITNDDIITKTLTARIDKRTVYVTVKEVEPLVTEVVVQARTSRGTGDLTMASEVDKQIALGLVLPQN